MHPYIHELNVPVVLAERRRQAPARRIRRDRRWTRRAGGGLVAIGASLASLGRRLQGPAQPGADAVRCAA